MGNSDFQRMVLTETVLPKEPEEIFKQIENFKELMLTYNSAIREVTTKLEILNDELSLDDGKNPIQFIKSRVKKPLSIVDKLQRLGKEINVESIMGSLNDVAGIRVIASFVDDVYKIADMLVKQDDIFLVEAKDYIKNPKPNGYRSYHLIIEVPVFFSQKKQWIRVEVQIRTVAMDFWASLEHQVKYKKELKDTKEIERELKECADTIAATDVQMMNIRNKIDDIIL
ncbi:GTP pyrophosphokinase family protein [Clostridium algidicarnis]|uniref:GTP pyrophosphokinase n=1 Tax=Clostridium algidicarnis TaxID=37659 RepID=UPI001C0C0514|nr:GTP pyrophosphokinase family protein [Clostridium algidicarnis]MBU3208004.1 GTP pyrophosphokinase family protein [Clostridium algidicarnis]